MQVGRLDRAATTDAPTCISRIRCASSSVRRLNGLASRDRASREIVDATEAVDLAVAGQDAGTVVDEKEKERDRYAPWLHREVQGRVAGPVVQLRFISLFPGRARVSGSEHAHHGATDLA